jgi:hypothetical protein
MVPLDFVEVSMTTKITIAWALALGAGLALAAGAAEQAKTTHSTATHSAHKTLTGCLEKGDEANTYKLTHVAGGGDWELVDAPAALKISDHLGHKVEITGTSVSAAAAEKMEEKGTKEKAETKTKEAKEMKEEKGEHHLKVTALKHVSPTCP